MHLVRNQDQTHSQNFPRPLQGERVRVRGLSFKAFNMPSATGLQKRGGLALVHGCRKFPFKFRLVGDTFIDFHPEIRFTAFGHEPARGSSRLFDRGQQLFDPRFSRFRLRRILLISGC